MDNSVSAQPQYNPSLPTDDSDHLMHILNQILTKEPGSKDPAKDASVEEVRGSKETLSSNFLVVGAQTMPEPQEPFVGATGLSEGAHDLLAALDNDKLLALIGRAMAVLIKTNADMSASQRKTRMEEVMQALDERLKGVEALLSASKSALIASCVSSSVGIAGGIAGAGMGLRSMSHTAKASSIRSEASALKNPDTMQLAGVSSGGSKVATSELADMGSGSIDTLKKGLLEKASLIEARAQKMQIAGESMSRTAASGAGLGSAASSTIIAQGQALQAEKDALATVDTAEADVAADWMVRMGGVRDEMLRLLAEINKSYAQATSAAFKS